MRKLVMSGVPIVTVAQGQLKGKTFTNYTGERFYGFQGIPYAKPPVGNLRFKAPQPADPWTGVFDATKEGPECPSTHMLLHYGVGKEDNCLHVNVYTKQLPQTSKDLKPVMVWIHGGGFCQGSNKTEIVGPDYLMMEDIVLVVVNYRLNVFGFLSLEDSSLEVPGNAGLKDQVLALKWIQNNIASFNGDPNNVTIFGESAGAGSVHYLLLSPLCKGLFHKAIIQSGCALNYWADGTKGHQEFCKLLGYKAANEKSLLEYLLKAPAQKLVSAASKSVETCVPSDTRLFGPVIEKPSPDAFISEKPENIIKSGNYNKVPIMVGYTTREGFLFDLARKLRADIPLPKDFSGEVNHNIIQKLESNTANEAHKKIKQFYYGNEDATDDNLEKTILMKSDTCFIYDIYRSIKLHQANLSNPIYVYRMSVESSLNMYKRAATVKWIKSYFLSLLMLKGCEAGISNSLCVKLVHSFACKDMEGVSHADDLSYLFKMFWSPKVQPGSIEDISIRRFVKMWTNFAKFTDPTPDEESSEFLKVKWKPLDGDFMVLDIGKELSFQNNPDLERLKFWDDLYNELVKS